MGMRNACFSPELRAAVRLALPLLLALAASAQVRPRGHRLPLPASPRVSAPIPFRAVGLLEEARGLRVRASEDGVVWTEWREAEDGLVYFGELHRYLEWEGPRGRRAEILFIDPGVTAAAPVPRATPGAPPIVSREQWGCTPQTCPQAEAPSYTTPTHLIVHHSAGTNSAADWAAVVRSIWVLHVQGNGWNDIGYNYLVDPNGVLYEGRAGGDGVLGAHFSSVNGGTVGICLLGTFSTQRAPDPALATLEAALAWQAGKWTIDPLAKRLHASSRLLLDTVSGHRDANLASGGTECPGNGLFAVLPAIRRRVYAALAGDCPVAVSGQNFCAPREGSTLAFTAAGCSPDVAGAPAWLAPGPSGIAVEPNAGARRTGEFTIGGRIISVTQAGAGEPPLPCPVWGGVVSAAPDAGRPVAPGSLISIYGSNLAGGSVTVNGRAATIFYSGPNQINAQLPAATTIGSSRAVVTVDGVPSPDAMFSVTEAVPAVFAMGERAIAVNFDDGLLNGPSAPARAGSVITVYLTGAGRTTTATPAPVASPWSATIGELPAGGLFLGLAPGWAGLYQANLSLPADLKTGDHPLVITVAGVSSVPALVSVAAR